MNDLHAGLVLCANLAKSPPEEFGQAFFANEAKVKLSAFSQLKSMECDVSED